jgi:hypothetical protein
MQRSGVPEQAVELNGAAVGAECSHDHYDCARVLGHHEPHGRMVRLGWVVPVEGGCATRRRSRSSSSQPCRRSREGWHARVWNAGRSASARRSGRARRARPQRRCRPECDGLRGCRRARSGAMCVTRRSGRHGLVADSDPKSEARLVSRHPKSRSSPAPETIDPHPWRRSSRQATCM